MEAHDQSAAHKAGVLALVIVPLLGLIAGIILGIDSTSAVLFGALSALTILGVTIGFHRLATHKSFETYGWIKFILLVFGSMTGQGRIHKDWGPMHVHHHVHSDEEEDLHSPMKGFWKSHIGWMFANDPEPYGKYEKGFVSDPVIRTVGRFFPLWVILGLLLPAAIGYLVEGTAMGLVLGFVWGGLVRMLFVNHVTWSVNSICHMFGPKHFQAGDDSRNNVVVGILALGEGWHNNHHAFPRSAKHGLLWWQFDMSYAIIRFMETIGLAWDVYVPDTGLLNAKRIR